MGTYNEFQHSSCLAIVLHGETRHCLTGSVTQSLLYWPSICLVVSVFTWFLQHKMKTNVIEQHFTDVSSTKSVEEKRLMKKSKICAKIIETFHRTSRITRDWIVLYDREIIISCTRCNKKQALNSFNRTNHFSNSPSIINPSNIFQFIHRFTRNEIYSILLFYICEKNL